MSMHKRLLTDHEIEGLTLHNLTVDSPSQLSDAFRLGMAWAIKKYEKMNNIKDWLIKNSYVSEELSNNSCSIPTEIVELKLYELNKQIALLEESNKIKEQRIFELESN
jgi:hypothetical protein